MTTQRTIVSTCAEFYSVILMTYSRVPGITIKAVGIVAHFVKPSPVGINDNFSADVAAAATTLPSALLPGHLGMRLGLVAADLEGRYGGGRKKGRSGLESKRGHHDC